MKMMAGHGLGSYCMAGQGQAAEFCAHGNELRDSTNNRNFLTS